MVSWCKSWECDGSRCFGWVCNARACGLRGDGRAGDPEHGQLSCTARVTRGCRLLWPGWGSPEQPKWGRELGEAALHPHWHLCSCWRRAGPAAGSCWNFLLLQLLSSLSHLHHKFPDSNALPNYSTPPNCNALPNCSALPNCNEFPNCNAFPNCKPCCSGGGADA